MRILLIGGGGIFAEGLRACGAKVKTWVTEGTPGGTVLPTIDKLAKDEIHPVVLGINEGRNQDINVIASGQQPAE